MAAAWAGASPETENFCFDTIPHRSPEETVEGQAGDLTEDVPEGHLQAGLGEGVVGDGGVDGGHEALDFGWVLAGEHGREDAVDEVGGSYLVFAAPDRGTGDLAEAFDAGVGVDSDEEEGGLGMAAATAADSPFGADGDVDWDCFDLRYLQLVPSPLE